MYLLHFCNASGSNEYIVLLEEEPTKTDIEDWQGHDCDLECCIEIERTDGLNFDTGLPTNYTLQRS